MLHCYLQVFLCTEIAVQEDFAPSKYDFWRDLIRRGLKTFLGSLSLAILYVHLIH